MNHDPTNKLHRAALAAFNAKHNDGVTLSDFPNEQLRDEYLLVVDAVLGSYRTSEFNEQAAA